MGPSVATRQQWLLLNSHGFSLINLIRISFVFLLVSKLQIMVGMGRRKETESGLTKTV